ncbi:hypothetical protein RU639_007586 [Aspergillus parasiticus]
MDRQSTNKIYPISSGSYAQNPQDANNTSFNLNKTLLLYSNSTHLTSFLPSATPKMRFIPVAFGLMATTSVMANPVNVQSVTVQLANDQSGANANVDIPADGNPRSVQALWGKTSVSTNGVVSASSAQLNKFQQTTHCQITQHPNVNAELDAQRTWTQLDHGKVVQLNQASIVCKD